MSSPTTAFEKSLRSLQTGGLTYTDFFADLKEMLAAGASAIELQHVLERRQAIEPMSDIAYAEVAGVLNEAARAATAETTAVASESASSSVDGSVAIPRDRADVAPQEESVMVKAVRNSAVTPLGGGRPRPAGRAPPAAAAGPQLFSIPSVPTDGADPGAAARAAELTAARGALEAAQNKTREITELARSRLAEAHQETERLRSELTKLRQSLAEREAEKVKLQHEQATLRHEYATLQHEHTTITPGLEVRAGTLALELVAAKNALEAERRKGADTQRLRDALAARDAEVAARDAEIASRDATLAAYETDRATARAAHDRALAALKEEHAKALRGHESRASSRVHLEADLKEALEQIAALTAELAARDTSLASYETELAASRAAHEKLVAALKEEHAKALRAHESRAVGRMQLEFDLKAALEQNASLTADLAAVQRALEDQQQQAGEGTAEFAQRTAAAEAARTEAEAALRAAEQQLRTADQQLRAAEHHQSDAKHAREALAERDRELVALRQEQTKTARLLDARAERTTQLQADLTAARARADAIEAELKASQEAAARMVADLKRRETELDAARSELGAVKTQSNAYLESLRNRDWRQGYEHSQGTESAPAAPIAVVDAPTVPYPQPARAPDAALRVEPLPPAEAVAPFRAGPAGVRVAASARVRKPGGLQLGALAVAALLILMGVGWLIARHKSAPTPALSASAAAVAPGSVIQDCATCPTFTVLPAGRFKQGSAVTDPGYTAFEGPQHWVALAQPLAMSINPVTVDQFARFVEATGRDMQGCDIYDGGWKRRPDASWKNPGFAQGGNHPVTCVSFNDATAYAQWLSAQTGHTYRLPSASEWEYAARAGGAAAQPWDTPAAACANANVADASAARRYPAWRVFACDDGFVNTSPVGSFKPNDFGLNDMLGNVFQWTQDCWNADYSGAPVDGSARNSGDCSAHELRGGSWFSSPKYVRAAYRNQFAADYRTSSVGIRLVREG